MGGRRGGERNREVSGEPRCCRSVSLWGSHRKQKAATRRNMRREERGTVQGPRKGTATDGMSHGGGGGGGQMHFVLHFCALQFLFVYCGSPWARVCHVASAVQVAVTHVLVHHLLCRTTNCIAPGVSLFLGLLFFLAFLCIALFCRLKSQLLPPPPPPPPLPLG